MKYLLADVLVYNDEEGTFSHIDAPDDAHQILTGTANAVMKLLVRHHGNVVERELFFSEVWDARGVQGSNNSLNQYISILRKMLAGFVPEKPAIVTVPKKGFMLSADIRVQPLPDPSDKHSYAPRCFPPALVLCTFINLVAIALCLWNTGKTQTPARAEMSARFLVGECPFIAAPLRTDALYFPP